MNIIRHFIFDLSQDNEKIETKHQFELEKTVLKYQICEISNLRVGGLMMENNVLYTYIYLWHSKT